MLKVKNIFFFVEFSLIFKVDFVEVNSLQQILGTFSKVE